WIQLCATLEDCAVVLRHCELHNTQQCQRVDRRLDQSAGGWLTRSDTARASAGPPIRAGEIVVCLWIEDDVRDTTVTPLRCKQCFQLTQPAIEIHVGQSQGNERAIPAPLVRI